VADRTQAHGTFREHFAFHELRPGNIAVCEAGKDWSPTPN
jgi:hypothetical protein